jgi:alpha-L-fucosidase
VLDETFKTNLAGGKIAQASSARAGHSAQHAVDGDVATYWTPQEGGTEVTLEVNLGQPETFDRAMLKEMINTGQRGEAFELQAWDGQQWKPFATGTTIGYKRLLKFPAQTASRVRLVIVDSRDCPTIREFGLFKASEKETD